MDNEFFADSRGRLCSLSKKLSAGCLLMYDTGILKRQLHPNMPNMGYFMVFLGTLARICLIPYLCHFQTFLDFSKSKTGSQKTWTTTCIFGEIVMFWVTNSRVLLSDLLPSSKEELYSLKNDTIKNCTKVRGTRVNKRVFFRNKLGCFLGCWVHPGNQRGHVGTTWPRDVWRYIVLPRTCGFSPNHNFTYDL